MRIGDDARNYMAAMGGLDRLFGGADHDILWGNDGNDQLNGEHGLDWVLGGLGNDLLTGAQGNDRIVAGRGADLVAGDVGDDILYSIEVDGAVDQVDCGESPGDFDRVFVRAEDVVSHCEWWRVFR
jgi:Ca2+-binding RTX toxin-like protein